MDKFYEQHPEKAFELVASQILDGWSMEDIKNYWYALGYDIFFIKSRIEPFVNKPYSEVK